MTTGVVPVGVIDHRRGLQERLLFVLSICLTPFLIFGGFDAYFEWLDFREDRRRELFFEVERRMDQVDADIANVAGLIAVFSDEIEPDKCGVIYERLSPHVSWLRGILLLDGSAVICSGGYTAGADVIINSFPPEAEENALAFVPDGGDGEVRLAARQETALGHAIFILDASHLLDRTEASDTDDAFTLALIDKQGASIGTLPDTDRNIDWRSRTLQHNGRLTETFAEGRTQDILITPLGYGQLFAVGASERPPLWHAARLSPITTVGLPVAVFVAALLAVWITVDRLVLRWLVHLRRMAAAYAIGLYEHSPEADFTGAPEELERLASTMERMAGKIAGRDQELRHALELKDQAVLEIKHRVKNNLQIINSFVSLQLRGLSSPEARDALTDVKNRVGTLSIVHHTLYKHERLDIVSLQPFFDALLAHLEQALAMDDAQVKIQWSIADVNRPSDDIVPLALFVLEALTNSMAFAFDESGGSIHVNLEETEQSVRLTITDHTDRALKQDTQKGTGGLGTKLMTAFAKQLKATMAAEPTATGYKVTLDLPRQQNGQPEQNRPAP